MPAQRSKEVNLYLSIISLIKEGKSLKDICSILNKSKQALNPYIKTLKVNGIIQKIGYGVWEVKNMPAKEVKILGAVGHQCPTKEVKKEVRGHAYQFTLKIPKLANWSRREEYLRSHDIQFTPITSNHSHRIIFKDHKVWLTPISVVVYFHEGKSYFTSMAHEAKSYAVYDFQQLIIGLENLLNVSFRIRGQHIFRTSRQHYSLLENALAKQYNREGKKLYVSNWKGQWLCIDFSNHVNELETLSPKTAIQDNELVQRDFNDLKEMQMTRKDIVETFEERFGKLLTAMNVTQQQIQQIVVMQGMNIQPLDDGDNKKLPSYIS